MESPPSSQEEPLAMVQFGTDRMGSSSVEKTLESWADSKLSMSQQHTGSKDSQLPPTWSGAEALALQGETEGLFSLQKKVLGRPNSHLSGPIGRLSRQWSWDLHSSA